jgi:hypothetical protein
MRQLDDVDQPNVSFASFDPTDVVSMQVRQLRETLLGKAALRPQLANAPAEEYAWVLFSHLKLWCGVNTMSSTHYQCDIRRWMIQPPVPGASVQPGTFGKSGGVGIDSGAASAIERD